MDSDDLSLQCLSKRLLKHFRSRQKQMTFVVTGALMDKCHYIECLEALDIFYIYEPNHSN